MVDEQPPSAAPEKAVPTSRVYFRPPSDWKTLTREQKIAWAKQVLAPLSGQEAQPGHRR